AYKPRPYDGAVTLFRSPGHQLLCSFDDQYGWGELALGGVAVRIISGAHEQILKEPHVQFVAKQMAECLEAMRSNAPKSSAVNGDGAGNDAAAASGLRVRVVVEATPA